MRKRDYLLFVLGITMGLRAGDLRQLKVCDVIDKDGNLRDKLVLNEDKTGKERTLMLSDTALDALDYFFQDKVIDYEDTLFKNFSHNNSEKYFETVAPRRKEKSKTYRYTAKHGVKDGIEVQSISRILKRIVAEANVNVHACSHMLRKTYGYQLANSFDDWTRGILFAQEAFRHKDSRTTLRYLGITGKEMEAAQKGLNFGSENDRRKKGELMGI